MPYKNYPNELYIRRFKYANDPIWREKRKETNRRSYHKHIEKRREGTRLYRLKNKEKVKQINFVARLKYRFGISLEEYNVLLKQQNGKCAICKNSPGGNRLDIDHDHKTNIIRGLLCRSCNRFLGIIENRDMKLIENYLLRSNPLKKKTKIRTRKWDGTTIFPQGEG